MGQDSSATPSPGLSLRSRQRKYYFCVSKLWPLLLLPLILSGCAKVNATTVPDVSGRTIKAVATTGMIGDIVTNVAGERVELSTLMGPGIDPHLYKASEGDVQDLVEADVIFYNGLHLEAKMSDVLERLEGGVITAAVTSRLPRSELLRPPQFAGAYDPHVWFDVRYWMEAARTVRDTLEELDPAHAELYQRNAGRYLRDLEELDREVRMLTATVPDGRRVLVTAHDAFNYFGRAYGFEVRGLQGISTATEAGTGDVQDLARFIADRRIPAVFVESSDSQRTIEAVREAVRSRGFDVQIGGQLYSDAMGDPGTPDGTYMGMVRHNVRTIVTALRGEIEP